MKTRKWLSWILAIVISLAALGAVGFFSYRMGYAHGAVATLGNGAATAGQFPFFGPMMQQRGFDGKGFGFMPHMRGNYGPMMGGGFHHGFGGGFFFPLFGLLQLGFWALVIFALYKLIAGSGWRFVKTDSTSAPAAEEKN